VVKPGFSTKRITVLTVVVLEDRADS